MTDDNHLEPFELPAEAVMLPAVAGKRSINMKGTVQVSPHEFIRNHVLIGGKCQ